MRASGSVHSSSGVTPAIVTDGGPRVDYGPPLIIQILLYYFWVETLVPRDALARFGYALSDSTRSLILLCLRQGPRYPSDLADEIGVSRQIVSNHLACLRGCGLVVAAPEGRRARYELADPRIGHALDDLVGLVLAVDPACCPSGDGECC